MNDVSILKTIAMITILPLLFSFLFTLISCSDLKNHEHPDSFRKKLVPSSVREISLPTGYNIELGNDPAYANWLLNRRIKPGSTVFLYNGSPKKYQGAQYAVLDLDIGKKDLVQCADAAIKLRADHLYELKKYSQINFNATSGDELSFEKWLNGIRWKEKSGKLQMYSTSIKTVDTISAYHSFMELVYSYCGTYSLSKQLIHVKDEHLIQPGDIFIQGGFPGHAITVMAVAKNETGNKILLIAQGYMPAQDIHVLKNPVNQNLSPWYDTEELFPLFTPQWEFGKGSLKRWPIIE